jgi:hypothetical protein
MRGNRRQKSPICWTRDGVTTPCGSTDRAITPYMSGVSCPVCAAAVQEVVEDLKARIVLTARPGNDQRPVAGTTPPASGTAG